MFIDQSPHFQPNPVLEKIKVVSSTPQQSDSLFNRLLEGELSPQDTEALIAWLGSKELDPKAAEMIMTQLKQSVDHGEISAEISKALEARLPAILGQSKQEPARRISIFRKQWMRYAAALVVLIGTAIFFLVYKQQITKRGGDVSVAPLKPVDVPPGKEGAILTLEDGSTMVLDSMGNGVVANQNGTKVLLNNGQLVYNKDGSVSGLTFNTMTTPKGRQFKLVLQDGTKVWLNAASSIRYPTVFAGKERKVEVTGEVYFEVTKNEKTPFHVKVNDKTEIEVLGTHFNVNSYKNESSINTSLLEGSVRIVNGDEKAVLKPGQQAQINGQTKIKVVNDVDMEKVMAWKNGVFNFEDATLGEVMRQLERWYDIEVVYEKGVPEFEFIGKMGRDLTLSEVVRGLEMSKVHCKIEEGRKLVVLP